MAGLRLQSNCAVVSFQDSRDYVKAQTFARCGFVGVQAAEDSEDFFVVFRGDADTVIRHTVNRTVEFLPSCNSYSSGAAVVEVLNGVVYEIGEQLGDLAFVAKAGR